MTNNSNILIMIHNYYNNNSNNNNNNFIILIIIIILIIKTFIENQLINTGIVKRIKLYCSNYKKFNDNIRIINNHNHNNILCYFILQHSPFVTTFSKTVTVSSFIVHIFMCYVKRAF